MIGLDVGKRRIGVAVSDPSGTLARPAGVLHVTAQGAVDAAALEIARLAAEEDGVAGVVIGLPRRLDGSPTAMTPFVEVFTERLRGRMPVPVFLQDERLTSREAESRLALRIRDWRSRKARLDAAAAAVILQDFLDTRAAVPPAADRAESEV